MSLEEVEQAAAKIKNLARVLEEAPASENAKTLDGTCVSYRREMHGRFGNVGEQLVRISVAARLFKKSSIDLNTARDELHRAVGSMKIAIDLHRHGFAAASRTD
jgi:hypothetical protein